MKKIVITLFLGVSLCSYAKLPSKWVPITSTEDGDIFYGNLEDQAGGRNSAWIGINYKNGKSKMFVERADCNGRTISSSNSTLYSKHDFRGKVLRSDDGLQGIHISTVRPDTVGEAMFNFICYGVY